MVHFQLIGNFPFSCLMLINDLAQHINYVTINVFADGGAI